MAEIVQPEGEALRRAVLWISAQRGDRPEADPTSLIEEAAFRFDLTPAQTQFLLDHRPDRDHEVSSPTD